MMSSSSWSAVAAVAAGIATIRAAGAPPMARAASPADGCNNHTPSVYTQLPHGQATYDVDDGGCYLCAKFPGSSFPLTDMHLLSMTCRQLCNTEEECTAFTVARPGVLHAHEYFWGKAANCCLERREFPPGTWVNASSNDGDVLTPCQLDIACWTRYERSNDGSGRLECNDDHVAEYSSSNLCTRVWKPRKYSDERIQQKIDFIAEGCDFKDEEMTSMLEEAYAECSTEIEAEERVIGAGAVGDTAYHLNIHQSAWMVHGTLGFIAFGVLVPLAMSVVLFRDSIPAYYGNILVCINATIFTLTFVAVWIAFATLNGIGSAGEGHLKEMHHVVGLLLLLLVSLLLSANGYIRRQSRLVLRDEGGEGDSGHDSGKSYHMRTMLNLGCFVGGSLVFSVGTYQIYSGLGLFARRYGTVDYRQAYLGYIFWLMAAFLGGRWWAKWRAQYNEMVAAEMQIHDSCSLIPS